MFLVIAQENTEKENLKTSRIKTRFSRSLKAREIFLKPARMRPELIKHTQEHMRE